MPRRNNSKILHSNDSSRRSNLVVNCKGIGKFDLKQFLICYTIFSMEVVNCKLLARSPRCSETDWFCYHLNYLRYPVWIFAKLSVDLI